MLQPIQGKQFSTASWAVNAISASWAPMQSIDTSSFATTGSNIFFGNQNIKGSVVEGSGSSTIGVYSHAEGLLNNTYGDYSHAEGSSNNSVGDYSHAEGERTTSQGPFSHTEGYTTVASGQYTHAEGTNTSAQGQGSHAEGEETGALGQSSHSEGFQTLAIGDYSHAEGIQTEANADGSHAEGIGTIALAKFQHVQGKFNQEDSENEGAFIVGNGLDNSNRSNLIKAYSNTVEITGSLLVAGSLGGNLIGSASYAESASWAPHRILIRLP